MPDISPEQALAALHAGLAKGGHGEFTTEIARNPRMFGDVVLYGLQSLFPETRFTREGDLEFTAYGSGEGEDQLRARLRLGRRFTMLDRFSVEKCLTVTTLTIAEFEEQLSDAFDDDRRPVEGTLDDVVALLKHRRLVEKNNAEMARRPSLGPRTMASWEVGGDVWATAAFDLPSQFQFLTTKELGDLGASIDDVREAAVANIARKMDEVGLLGLEEPLVPEDGGVAALGKIGGLASSILLVDDFWRRQVELCGEPLCILARETDEILVWRSSDLENAVAVMGALAMGAEKSVLPSTIFFHDGEELRILAPDSLPNEAVARYH